MTNKECIERFGEQPKKCTSIEYDMYEGRIKRAVRESINKLLLENDLLLEYYGTRDKFKSNVKNRLEQIFQNYCLISYGKLFNKTEVKHWRVEYDSYMNFIYDFQITNNDSSKARYKALTEAFDEWFSKFNSYVEKFKKNKLEAEHIDPNCKEINNAIQAFCDNAETIKKYLARFDVVRYEEFI